MSGLSVEEGDGDFIPYDGDYTAVEEWQDCSLAKINKRGGSRVKGVTSKYQAVSAKASPTRAAKVIVIPKRCSLPHATVTITRKTKTNEQRND